MTGPDSSPDDGAVLHSFSHQDETQLIRYWDPIIKKKAKAAARGDYALAEDLAQDARLRLILTKRRLPKAPAAYFYKVILSAVGEGGRVEARSWSCRTAGATSDVDDLQAHEQEVELDRTLDSIEGWVGKLPPRLQQVYENVYCFDRSQRDAAKQMKLSQPRVAHYHRQLIEAGREEFERISA